MEQNKLYKLPPLPYKYTDLQPYISEQQLTLHHDKHHLAYVNGANNILQKLDKARGEGLEIDVKSTLKELSFHIGGHLLHSTFWGNLAPPSKGGGTPGGVLADQLIKEFTSFEKFKKEFTQAAVSVEGSGWAALSFCKQTGRPIIMQIEKHNVNVYPGFTILLVLDVWEHAYYLDYKNDRSKFVEAFWSIVNWDDVNKKIQKII
ncbi:MAG: superoxide dismutase [Candidatus Odinarchaeum yellowstonii]|uniref:Superoxide dismutase n=1 Tax=Odinarchaeota yellowstonii (strain LCB_4) TaxID=1841599 RepID=A0AAF0IBM0_ODILC|nr:MAG: superoxide dismutase [Candidatus Odinarchaeum yellowstonii]